MSLNNISKLFLMLALSSIRLNALDTAMLSIKDILLFTHNLQPDHTCQNLHIVVKDINSGCNHASKEVITCALEETCVLLDANKQNIDETELACLITSIDCCCESLKKQESNEVALEKIAVSPATRAAFYNVFAQNQLQTQQLTVSQGTSLNTLNVIHNANILGNANVTHLNTTGGANLTGNVIITGDLTVTGSTTTVSSVTLTTTNSLILESNGSNQACLIFEENGVEQGRICSPSSSSLGLNMTTGNGGTLTMGNTSGAVANTVQIGNSAGTGANTISVGSTSSTGVNTINIGTQTAGTAANQITIGGTGTTTTILGTLVSPASGNTTIVGTLTQTGGAVSIGADSAINPISIGTGTTGGGRTITIGNASNTNIITGTTDIIGTTTIIGATAVIGAFTQTAGDVNIGAGPTTNTINIGTGGSFVAITGTTSITGILNQLGSGNVNIGSDAVNQTLNFGTGAPSVKSIFIGNNTLNTAVTVKAGPTITGTQNFTSAGLLVNYGTQTAGIYVGAGDPNGNLTAAKGSLYLNTTGSGLNDRAFINTNGATSWAAITTS